MLKMAYDETTLLLNVPHLPSLALNVVAASSFLICGLATVAVVARGDTGVVAAAVSLSSKYEDREWFSC